MPPSDQPGRSRPIPHSIPDPNEQRLSATLPEIIDRLLAREAEEPVAPFLPPDEIRDRLDIGLSAHGAGEARTLAALEEILQTAPRTATPKFFNQLYGGRDPVATMADMLASFTNNSVYTYKVGGPHVAIEMEVVARLARFAGFERGEGILCPGGSMANLAAMVVARNDAAPSVKERGVSSVPLTVYASENAHYSVRKNAGVIGLGREMCRAVPTDDAGRMNAGALHDMIVEDMEADRFPFMVVATAGTTVEGAYDPLHDIANIADAFDLWLHVDGALGATALLSRKHKRLLACIERADSLTWNPHKLMGVPMPCSALLVRHPGMLAKHFNESAEYLFQTDDDFNPGRKSLQCGRRNDALKLWALWKRYGDEGLERRTDHLLDIAAFTARQIEERHGMTLTLAPESVCVCFEVDGRCSEAICERLRAEQRALVGYGIVNGKRIIRLVCVNHDLTEAGILAFLDDVEQVGAHAPPSTNLVESTETAACDYKRRKN